MKYAQINAALREELQRLVPEQIDAEPLEDGSGAFVYVYCADQEAHFIVPFPDDVPMSTEALVAALQQGRLPRPAFSLAINNPPITIEEVPDATSDANDLQIA
jgi:hypothetical protein